MTRNEAIEKAKQASVEAKAFYVVAHDAASGQFVFGALKAINLIHPGVRASNYDLLVNPEGKAFQL